jgi:hypothetical protein
MAGHRLVITDGDETPITDRDRLRDNASPCRP